MTLSEDIKIVHTCNQPPDEIQFTSDDFSEQVRSTLNNHLLSVIGEFPNEESSLNTIIKRLNLPEYEYKEFTTNLLDYLRVGKNGIDDLIPLIKEPQIGTSLQYMFRTTYEEGDSNNDYGMSHKRGERNNKGVEINELVFFYKNYHSLWDIGINSLDGSMNSLYFIHKIAPIFNKIIANRGEPFFRLILEISELCPRDKIEYFYLHELDSIIGLIDLDSDIFESLLNKKLNEENFSYKEFIELIKYNLNTSIIEGGENTGANGMNKKVISDTNNTELEKFKLLMGNNYYNYIQNKDIVKNTILFHDLHPQTFQSLLDNEIIQKIYSLPHKINIISIFNKLGDKADSVINIIINTKHITKSFFQNLEKIIDTDEEVLNQLINFDNNFNHLCQKSIFNKGSNYNGVLFLIENNLNFLELLIEEISTEPGKINDETITNFHDFIINNNEDEYNGIIRELSSESISTADIINNCFPLLTLYSSKTQQEKSNLTTLIKDIYSKTDSANGILGNITKAISNKQLENIISLYAKYQYHPLVFYHGYQIERMIELYDKLGEESIQLISEETPNTSTKEHFFDVFSDSITYFKTLESYEIGIRDKEYLIHKLKTFNITNISVLPLLNLLNKSNIAIDDINDTSLRLIIKAATLSLNSLEYILINDTSSIKNFSKIYKFLYKYPEYVTESIEYTKKHGISISELLAENTHDEILSILGYEGKTKKLTKSTPIQQLGYNIYGLTGKLKLTNLLASKNNWEEEFPKLFETEFKNKQEGKAKWLHVYQTLAKLPKLIEGIISENYINSHLDVKDILGNVILEIKNQLELLPKDLIYSVLNHASKYIETIKVVDKYYENYKDNPKKLLALSRGISENQIHGNITMERFGANFAYYVSTPGDYNVIYSGGEESRCEATKSGGFSSGWSNINELQGTCTVVNGAKGSNPYIDCTVVHENRHSNNNKMMPDYSNNDPLSRAKDEIIAFISDGRDEAILTDYLVETGKDALYDYYSGVKEEYGEQKYTKLREKYEQELKASIRIAYTLKKLKIENYLDLLTLVPVRKWMFLERLFIY